MVQAFHKIQIPGESKRYTRFIGCGLKDMWPKFITVVKFVAKIIQLKEPKIRKMIVRGFVLKREFHVPVLPMIYSALKHKFYTMFIFRNRILIT